MLFVVAAALVDEDGRILLAQRPEGKPMAGLWEFPGGKVHEDELPAEALVRELREELAIQTAPCCLREASFVTHPLSATTVQPDIAYDAQGCDPLRDCPSYDPDDMLLLLLYICRRWHGTPTPVEGQQLKWVRLQDMQHYPMPPADKPLLAMLHDVL
jgi:8-oxo-dGTP diphosphatase